MRTKLIPLLVLAGATGATAWAQDTGGATTTARAPEVTQGAYDSAVEVTPRVGAIGFENSNNVYDSRIAEGIDLGWNLGGMVPEVRPFVLGITSGVLFSHIGAADSNFLGMNSVSNNTGTNAFVVPLEATFGYKFTDSTMASLLLGASGIYRSDNTQMLLGRADGTGGSSFDVFPTAGLALGLDLKSVGVTVRGDYIPTPIQDSFTATIGLTIPLA